MPLESATFIDGLNASNPVGSTDKVQTLDDHVRLIKSTVKASFPGVTGAVTATHTELNFVDGVTSAIQTQLDTKAAANALNASALTSGTVPDARFPATLPALSGVNLTALNATNLASGTVADARLSANVPLRNAANTYTVAGASFDTFVETGQATAYFGSSGGEAFLGSQSNHNVGFYANNASRGSINAATGNWTLNGVLQTDFARLSQNVAFQGTLSTVGAATLASLGVTGAATVGTTLGVTGAATLASLGVTGAATVGTTLGVTGAATLTGALTAATIANSDSETLVAGQLHFIDGNATLPNLTAGQWVEVINDSASPITISKNASDTTYWSLTGATVTTSFTLAARGRLSAVCNPAGSSVYVAGSGITGAT